MSVEEKQVRAAMKRFAVAGKFKDFELIQSGHINVTYKVYMETENGVEQYIAQRVNTYVFKNPELVMKNIADITGFIRAKLERNNLDADRYVLNYAKADTGDYFLVLPDGGFWRCCHFIQGSKSFLYPENEKIVEESGKAFGEFQLWLADFPVKDLGIVIPHFHNTVMRYETFKNAIEKDESRRRVWIEEEIEGYLALEEIATRLYRMQRRGEVPLRVTHNDTKTSNVLFDEKTDGHLSVIDLDTVMPGLVAFDFGDAIRIAGSTAGEDEKDLSKVDLDIVKFEAFARGFVGKVKDFLTENEKATLALGAVAMTVECGMRFLTDYLDGDKYFRVHYAEHNLVRARCHLVLATKMIERLDEMQAIVDKYCK